MINILGVISTILRLIRRRIYRSQIRKVAKEVGENLKVNFKSRVNRNTILGNNVSFNGVKIRGDGEVVIGDNFHSGPDILLLTRNHNYEGTKIPYDETYIRKKIVIEDNVWIGARCIIVGEVTIGEGAIIQAGSVVIKDIPPCGIAGGHPAKTFMYRDKDHYFKLKKEKKFH
ncbi:MAG: acyltransferase [Candidatus Heimdallarchaeota archaeon]|nr:acyltransferase [Candidatus Heimdallarchaeota archaeon]